MVSTPSSAARKLLCGRKVTTISRPLFRPQAARVDPAELAGGVPSLRKPAGRRRSRGFERAADVPARRSRTTRGDRTNHRRATQTTAREETRDEECQPALLPEDSRRCGRGGSDLLASPAGAAVNADPGAIEMAPTMPIPAEPVIAIVRDPGLGEVTVLVGTTETTYRDVQLARRLLKAAHKVSRAAKEGVA